MRVGLHKRLWVKNVVAIGLSAGFIEPLESNGLFTVHEFLMILLRNIQRDKFSQWDRDSYNYQCKLLFRNFAEFVALHYALSHRDDTEYWKANLNKNWEEKLINLNPTSIRGFVHAVDQRAHNFHFSERAGINCIAAGMHWSPTDLTSILHINNLKIEDHREDVEPFIKRLDERKKQWKSIVKNKPSLYKFLKTNIYNERK
jgi:hypothetical protein